MMKLGSTGLNVKKLQYNLEIEATGIFNELTEAAVKAAQLRFSMNRTGKLSEEDFHQWEKLLNPEYSYPDWLFHYDELPDNDNDDLHNDEATTDFNESKFSIDIDEDFLPPDEYVSDLGKFPNKQYIFLHHTAGRDNPHKTIKNWRDDDRGRIATHYLIGGRSTSDQQYDGKIVQCIPDDYYGFHLGGRVKHGIDLNMHKNSIGIEICNFGWLEKRGSGYYTWFGAKVDKAFVYDVGFKWRGFRYHHKYTQAQIDSTRKLLIFLSTKYDIDLRVGLQQWIKDTESSGDNIAECLRFRKEARDGKVKGLLSHTNVRTDKFDITPQEDMLWMIKNL